MHIPQPIHLLGSTTEAPQPKHLAVSALTCSSVNVSLASLNDFLWSNELSVPGICLEELS